MTGPVPAIVPVAAPPGLQTTVPPEREIGELRLRVLVSAFVEDRVQVETPEAFVRPQLP